MTQLDLSQLNPQKTVAPTRRRSVTRGLFAGPVALSFVAIALVFLVGIGYLYIENDLTTRGYQMRDLEKTVSQLKEESRRLEIESAQARSIDEIQKSVSQKLNMVEISSVHYLARTTNASGATVALSQVTRP